VRTDIRVRRDERFTRDRPCRRGDSERERVREGTDGRCKLQVTFAFASERVVRTDTVRRAYFGRETLRFESKTGTHGGVRSTALCYATTGIRDYYYAKVGGGVPKRGPPIFITCLSHNTRIVRFVSCEFSADFFSECCEQRR